MKKRCKLFVSILILLMFSQSVQAAEKPEFPSWIVDEPDTDIVYELGSYTKDFDSIDYWEISLENAYLKKEELFFISVNKLLLGYDREDGSHIQYMSISDAEYRELIGYIREYIKDESAEQVRKNKMICDNFYAAKNSNYNSTSLADLLDEYNWNQKSISSNETKLVSLFYEKVKNRMGDYVLEELVKYIAMLGHKSSISLSKGYRVGDRPIIELEGLFTDTCL